MEPTPTVTRRAVLAGGAAAAAAAWAGIAAAGPAEAADRRLPRRFGIQLFTLRELMDADPAGTLALLADIGYREVEIGASLHGLSAEQMRAALRRNGLRAIGGHQLVGPALIPFFGDRAVDDALDEAETLGQRYVGTAGITIPTGIVDGVGEPQTAARYRELAALANAWGAAASARGLRMYLHTHYWEFGQDPDTGEELFQILLDETDPALVDFEMDLFWIVFGGIDPLRWLEGNEERFPLFHVKDGIPDPAGGYFDPGFTDLGEGSLDFARIFAALDRPAAHHYIVERDDQPHPVQTARTAYAYLRDLRIPVSPRGRPA